MIIKETMKDVKCIDFARDQIHLLPQRDIEGDDGEAWKSLEEEYKEREGLPKEESR